MKRAFTLIELLVVIGIIALLLSVLLPALGRAHSQARSVVCKSNIRQLVLANLGYSSENDDSYVLGAEDIFTANMHRWHGVRAGINQPFDPLRGPLVYYLDDGEVKQCPQKVDFRHGDPWEWDYEDGAGGYGYNLTYLGSQLWSESDKPYANSAKYTQVQNPAGTLMFADTAMAKLDQGREYYLEYSFAEPPFFVFFCLRAQGNRPPKGDRSGPSPRSPPPGNRTYSRHSAADTQADGQSIACPVVQYLYPSAIPAPHSI